MSIAPRVAVVVVSYEARDTLLASLAALREHAGCPVELVVVDNASRDGSAEAVRERHPEALVIATPVNAGFGRACNQGWRASRAPLGSPGSEDTDEPSGGQRPGDANQDGRTDLSDAVGLLSYLFLEVPETLPCEGRGLGEGGNLAVFDLNGDAGVDIADPIFLLLHLFTGGSPPVLGTECIRVAGCVEVCSP